MACSTATTVRSAGYPRTAMHTEESNMYTSKLLCAQRATRRVALATDRPICAQRCAGEKPPGCSCNLVADQH
jgi:hypothetical protein